MSVVLTSSNAFANLVLAFPVQLLICSFGLRKVFCILVSGSKSSIVVPLTDKPAPSLLRFLGSGPRAGYGELILPSNEPGSSIMPGKVNPTQCEAISMVCAQIIGNDMAVSFAGANGHLELNVFKPLFAYNIIESSKLLGDACLSFSKKCIDGLEADKKKIKKFLTDSLMLVTALNSKIGYYKAAEIANKAYSEDITLKEACLKLKYLSENEFNKIVDPKKMI